MAVKLNAGDNVKRSDLYMVDPFQILVKEELRGRHTPPTDEQIIDMALSLMEHHQRQPVEVRKIAGNKLQLVLGFTRMAAIRLIVTGFNHPETGELIKDENFKIKCTITDANDETAFLNNVVENAHRNQTSFIDDAYNQQILRERHGKNDAEICRLYRYKDVNKVGRLRRLLSLPRPAQALVHEGRLPIQAALDILDIEDIDAQNQAFEQVYAECNGNGKVVAAEVRTMVRNAVLNDNDRDESEVGDKNGGERKVSGSKPLSMKEVRKFFEEVGKTHIDETMQKFCVTAVLWLGGKRADKTMLKAMNELLDAERS